MTMSMRDMEISTAKMIFEEIFGIFNQIDSFI
jgi:hypothetical protein